MLLLCYCVIVLLCYCVVVLLCCCVIVLLYCCAIVLLCYYVYLFRFSTNILVLLSHVFTLHYTTLHYTALLGGDNHAILMDSDTFWSPTTLSAIWNKYDCARNNKNILMSSEMSCWVGKYQYQ